MKALTLEDLHDLFHDAEDRPLYEEISGDEMPEPCRGLLVHGEHMTVTVEAYHGGPVDVRVLASRQDDDIYARKILLVHRATGKVVQFGIVRIDLGLTSEAVRSAILAGDTPLGRILIEHDVMRRIEPMKYVRIRPGPAQMAWFGMTREAPLHGRLAFIHCDGQPAVELLEVVAP